MTEEVDIGVERGCERAQGRVIGIREAATPDGGS